MNTDSKILGYFSACFAIVIWGITFVCTKHLLLYFSALEILFIRFIQAYVFLFILYPHKLKVSKKEKNDCKKGEFYEWFDFKSFD